MTDSTSAPVPATNWRRILVIIAIGLGAINIVQFAKGMLAERAFAEEQRQALSPQATTDRFHNLFYKNRNTLEQNRWMGIPALQNPNDVWITQEILFEVKPDFVGFKIPNEIVVGYGIDYHDRYHNLPYVAALEPHELDKATNG